MQRRYAILDVFTDRPLAGNPLAVVLDAEELDSARMQAIAREFNLSETVFVAPPENPVHTASIRIFTPGSELPFAGHPTVGAAVLLARELVRKDPGREDAVLILEEEVGPIRCGVVVRSDAAGHAIFDAPRAPAKAGEPGPKDAVAAALGLGPAEIGFENHRPSVFSAGNAFTFVPVRDLEVIGRARANTAIWSQGFSRDVLGAFLYCRETTASGRHFHARLFAPLQGIIEDPATGSAAAAFPGVILAFDEPPAGSHHYILEQGFEMGRPSLIGLEVDIDGVVVVATRIGGDAVVVAEGMLSV